MTYAEAETLSYAMGCPNGRTAQLIHPVANTLARRPWQKISWFAREWEQSTLRDMAKHGAVDRLYDKSGMPYYALPGTPNTNPNLITLAELDALWAEVAP